MPEFEGHTLKLVSERKRAVWSEAELIATLLDLETSQQIRQVWVLEGATVMLTWSS